MTVRNLRMRSVVDGAVLLGHDGEAVCTGLVLPFDDRDLVLGVLGDEWVLFVVRCQRPPLPTGLWHPSSAAASDNARPGRHAAQLQP